MKEINSTHLKTWFTLVLVGVGAWLLFCTGCGLTIPQRDTAVVPDPCSRRDGMMHPYPNNVTAPMPEPDDDI